MFFRSIRFKIMLWYMLLLTVTLLSFSFIVYGSFTKTLYNDLDDILTSRAEGIANSIDAYWTASHTSVQHDTPSAGIFAGMAADWIEPKRRDPELMSIYAQVLHTDGKTVVASKNMPRLEPLDKDDLEDLLDGEDDFDTVKGETAEVKKRMRFRTYTKPVMHNGRAEYLVQVAGPISLLTLASQNLVWVLFVLLPLTVVLAGLPGVILVRLTLKPVDKMIDTLRQTTAENLKLKIHIPDTDDEIKRLADTFNEMIDRLDRSFSSQQAFIQDLSAELKAPLAKLKEEFSSAAAGNLSPEECRSTMLRGVQQAEHFGRVIDELETLARYDNNRMPLEIRKVNLSGLLERILGAVKPQAEAKGISLSSVLKDAITIDGDEKQLAALFSSLLDNAVKYTNRKGSVTVTARISGRDAVVAVSDTGIGIEEGEAPYIFDRFYQATRSRSASGSFGLGLSIAKSVAEVHKGAITVESKIGRGSVFTVTLPVSYPA